MPRPTRALLVLALALCLACAGDRSGGGAAAPAGPPPSRRRRPRPARPRARSGPGPAGRARAGPPCVPVDGTGDAQGAPGRAAGHRASRGTLARVAVKRGQEVRTGALLASLDDGLAPATRRQAEAGVAAAHAQLALAEDALARVERLRREEGASESQLVAARAQRDLARAQLAAAQAQLDQAQVNLSHHLLTAPFAGVVTSVPDGIGITVGAGHAAGDAGHHPAAGAADLAHPGGGGRGPRR